MQKILRLLGITRLSKKQKHISIEKMTKFINFPLDEYVNYFNLDDDKQRLAIGKTHESRVGNVCIHFGILRNVAKVCDERGIPRKIDYMKFSIEISKYDWVVVSDVINLKSDLQNYDNPIEYVIDHFKETINNYA